MIKFDMATLNDASLQLNVSNETPEKLNSGLSSSHQSKPSFWFMHTIGWFFYVLVFSVDNIMFVGSYSKVGSMVIFPLVFSGIAAALLTWPLRYVYRQCWSLSASSLISIIGLSSLLVAMLWTPVKNAVMWYFLENFNVFDLLNNEVDTEFNPMGLFMTASYSFFMVLVWSSMYFGINYHFRLLNSKEKHLQAVRLSHTAQIKMLRYQINPHFLFNTLNAISTLVMRGSKEKANTMLIRLSTFLRFSLDNDPEKKVKLYDELKALMLYLEIEKTRFDERLSVVFRVEPRTESLLVPSLLLQPLVENAIKYAIAKMPSGGSVSISAKCRNNLLQLEVADNGPTKDIEEVLETSSIRTESETKQSRVGLRNIRERLHVLYPNHYLFSIRQNHPQGVKVFIEIPIEES